MVLVIRNHVRAINKTVAEEKERKFLTEILEGKHVPSRKILFETFTEKYLEYAKLNKKPKSAKRTRSQSIC
jgi:hypothetical protein